MSFFELWIFSIYSKLIIKIYIYILKKFIIFIFEIYLGNDDNLRYISMYIKSNIISQIEFI